MFQFTDVYDKNQAVQSVTRCKILNYLVVITG